MPLDVSILNIYRYEVENIIGRNPVIIEEPNILVMCLADRNERSRNCNCKFRQGYFYTGIKYVIKDFTL